MTVLDRSAHTSLDPSTRRDRRSRAAALDRCATDLDRAVADRTIPRETGQTVDRPAPSVDPELWLTHVCYARGRQPELRRLLVEEYQGYAASLARRLLRDGEPIEDLRQVAFEALVVALERFDPERGFPFTAFASPTIMGALKRHYRDFGWLMRVPRRVHELASPARQVTDTLAAELGRPPTPDEVARRMGIDTEELLEAQEAAAARSVGSLDSLVVAEDGSTREVFGEADPGFARTENLLSLRQALGELDPRDREVVRLSFFEGLTQTEIAEQFGVSQMQVSRWLTGSIKRLRSWIPAD